MNKMHVKGTTLGTAANPAAYDYLCRINKNVNIEEGLPAIENLLLNVYFREGISNKELARRLLLPIPVVTAIKKEFISFGLLLQDCGIRLAPKGKALLEEDLGFFGLNKELYNELLSDYWEKCETLMEISSMLAGIFAGRPPADVAIDQSKCTVDTAVKRAVLCLRHSVLIGKNILCMGDDDLVSIAIGFLLKRLYSDMECCRTKICVMDIDNRILGYIDKIAEAEGLPVSCIWRDFREPLLKASKEKYDCFFTDPPYTLQGMDLFLSRGLEALKSGSGHPVFLSYAHKSPDFDLAMQKCFMEKKLAVSEILNAFNSYEGAGIIGGISQMIILKTTSKSRTPAEECYEGAIYTGQLLRTIRTYSCKECGNTTRVGASERFKTVEELKENGCLKCHGSTFLLLDRNRV